jgi:hypothetical protein
MRAHTITTTARVGASARTKRTIVPGSILALSLAVVLLATTASSASAGWGLCVPENVGPSVTSFDFGDRQIGTTSPAQDFGLWVGGNTTINPRASAIGMKRR